MSKIITVGAKVQIDMSGKGHAWRDADERNCPANIVQEIECEIIDGKQKTCDGYTASNGLRYRWS